MNKAKKTKNRILETVHETAKGLHKIGLIDTMTMREFDSICLPEIPDYTPRKIRKIRLREKVSQPIFAIFLNVSPSTVKKWESGEKNPSGASLRLLYLFDHYGLQLMQYGQSGDNQSGKHHS